MGAEVEADFDAVFDELFDSSFRLAYRMLGDAAGAEDVAAEACARALAQWSRVGPLPYRTAWVLRVASNLAVDAIRKRTRELTVDVADVEEDDVALRLALGAALRALPKRQRETVTLRYLAELKEREVAEVLGLSIGTVKSHVSRGLAALRTKLGDSFEEADLA
jgi:RNA polymerase sigma factor (sigma-70 family)